MPIKNPSQYECDQIKDGDVIFVRQRSRLYKFIRDKYLKDKVKLKIKDVSGETQEYKSYYQEDCTLYYAWDLACIKTYKDCVPVLLSRNPGKFPYKTAILDSLNIGLLNVQLIFKSGKTLTIPVNWFDQGIKYNENIMKNIKDDRMVKSLIKFSPIKGNTFINIIKEENIEKWVPSYCTLCGKPVIFNFTEDKVVIDNKCSCGFNKLNMLELTYDEFALWYLSQTNEYIKDKYKKFWFERKR